jgi:hypothetical protein
MDNPDPGYGMDNPDSGSGMEKSRSGIRVGQSRSGINILEVRKTANKCAGELVLDPGPDLEGGGVRGSGQPEQLRPPASLVQINLPIRNIV